MTDQARLRRSLAIALRDTCPGLSLRLYDEIDSTNTRAKADAALVGADRLAPVLYIARAQTAGRGRLGRTFHSPAHTGLYMTLAYTTAEPLPAAVRATAEAAIAATAAVESLTNRRPAIKWVNDLYLDGAKLAGILTEAVTLPPVDGSPRTRMLVGIGMNLTTTRFPDGLRAPATSLFACGEAPADPVEFTGALAGTITRNLLALATTPGDSLPAVLGCSPADTGRLAFYRRRLLYRGQVVTVTQGDRSYEATLLDVDETHALLVEVDGQVVRLGSGEVSVRATST